MPYSGGGSSAAGSIVVGNPVSGGTNNTVLFINSSGNLASQANITISDAGTVTFNNAVTFTTTTSITNNNAFGLGGGVGTGGGIAYQTNLTPDAGVFYTGPAGNSIHIYEVGDAAFDFQNCSAGSGAATNPTLCIHSADGASTTKWIDIKHDGTNGVIDVGTGVVSFPDTVTLGAATSMNASGQINMTAASPLFNFGTSYGSIGGTTANTPDAPFINTQTVSNSWNLIEAADFGFDFNNGPCATSACTDPTFIIHSHNQTTTEWLSLNHNGDAAVIASGSGLLRVPGDVALNADYTNATATFSATALSVPVRSGRTYSFTMALTFADSTAADGAQFDFNGGSAAATNFRVQCTASNATGAALVLTNAGTTALATAVQVALALTTQAGITCNGTFVPSGNGTFIVRAAQTAHSTGTLTVHRGSWLKIRDANPL